MVRKKSTLCTGILLIVGAIAASGYLIEVSAKPNPPVGQTKVLIGNGVFDAELGDTAAAKARGLSYRANLPENRAMLFELGSPGRYGIWMKDMNFPLDIVWINGSKVVDVTKNAAPEPGHPLRQLTVYRPSAPADKVLEINAGDADKYGIRAGSGVKMETSQKPGQ